MPSASSCEQLSDPRRFALARSARYVRRSRPAFGLARRAGRNAFVLQELDGRDEAPKGVGAGAALVGKFLDIGLAFAATLGLIGAKVGPDVSCWTGIEELRKACATSLRRRPFATRS